MASFDCRTSTIPSDAVKVFSGKLFQIYRCHIELADGTIEELEFAHRPDTVVVLAFLDDQRTLGIEEQISTSGHVRRTLPGGVIEPGESVLTAAKRELLEETGYCTSAIEEWFSIKPANKIDWRIHFVTARNVVPFPVVRPANELTLLACMSLGEVNRWLTGSSVTILALKHEITKMLSASR